MAPAGGNCCPGQNMSAGLPAKTGLRRETPMFLLQLLVFAFWYPGARISFAARLPHRILPQTLKARSGPTLTKVIKQQCCCKHRACLGYICWSSQLPKEHRTNPNVRADFLLWRGYSNLAELDEAAKQIHSIPRFNHIT